MATQFRYPRYDLESSLEVAQALRDKGGGEASSNELASFLSYKSVNNGAFLSRVAAAKMFGFVDGQSSRLRCTDLALRVLQPDYPEVGQSGRIEAFARVPLFKAFLDEYEGQQLPTDEGKKNALKSKFGVSEKKAAMALARLMDSAEQAGLFDVAGDRTKLIRPLSRGQSPVPSSSEAIVPMDEPREAGKASSRLGIYPKLIEGALETVPWDGAMDEDGINEWIEFFRSAMKLHFRSGI